MIITARFASLCPCCNASIAIGSKVEWNKGSKARHVTCTGSTASVATVSRPARRERMGSGHGHAVAMPGFSSHCTDNASCRCYDCAS